jgi:hypothetical protein
MMSGCSNLSFKAGGRTPFKIATEKNSDHSLEMEGSADFFFWGFSPGKSTIDLEDVDQKLGLTRPSFVTIEQNVSWKNVFFTAITLGLYCPLDYKIKVLSVKEEL